jgi:hypothetical protein
MVGTPACCYCQNNPWRSYQVPPFYPYIFPKEEMDLEDIKKRLQELEEKSNAELPQSGS